MPCPICGAENPPGVQHCAKCGEKLSRRSRRLVNPADEEFLVPTITSNNPRALCSYRFALFGLIPFAGLVLGPAALAWGILGLRLERINPSNKGTAQALAGIVLGALELLTNWVGLLFLIIGWTSLQ